MVRWKHCPVCGRVVDEFEKECSQCGYDKVWEDDDDEAQGIPRSSEQRD